MRMEQSRMPQPAHETLSADHERARTVTPNGATPGAVSEDRIGVLLLAPALVGHRNARNLFEFNRQTMPLDKPGALLESDYWDVTAYILARQGLLTLPIDEVLGPTNAEQVGFLPR